MNYSTFSGLFQPVHDFSQQGLPLQHSQDLKDKDNHCLPNLLSVGNIQTVPDGIQRTMQTISSSSVQTVNAANYIITSPVINQSQLNFNAGNQLAPLHYITTPTTLNSNDLQVAWNDTNRVNNGMTDPLKNPINVPTFSTLPHNSLHMNSQTVWPLKSVTVDSVGTMTDPLLGSDLLELKPKPRINYDNIDCSQINLGIQSNALSQYLSRMPPQVLPSSVQHFLKKYNVPYNVKLPSNNLLPEEVSSIGMGSVNITVCKNKKNPSPYGKTTKSSLSTTSDGSFIFSCEICELKFSNKTMLHNHIISSGHEPDRKFRCDECGLCLKRKEHLDQHKKGHSQDRPFVCSICWKGFKRSEHLKRHYGTHTDMKCFACRICGKAFNRKDHLAKHEQTHVNRRLAEAYETILQSPNMSMSDASLTTANSLDKLDVMHRVENKQS